MQHHPSEGPQLWRNTVTGFVLVPMPIHVFDKSYGANVADLNGDGFEDIMLAPGVTTRTRILLNTGKGTFSENPPTTVDGSGGDVIHHCSGWYPSLFYRGPIDSLHWDPLVADVRGWILLGFGVTWMLIGTITMSRMVKVEA